MNVTEKLKFVWARLENIVGKMRKCWLPAFSPFPTMFSKDFFFKVVESQGIYWESVTVFYSFSLPLEKCKFTN